MLCICIITSTYRAFALQWRLSRRSPWTLSQSPPRSTRVLLRRPRRLPRRSPWTLSQAPSRSTTVLLRRPLTQLLSPRTLPSQTINATALSQAQPRRAVIRAALSQAPPNSTAFIRRRTLKIQTILQTPSLASRPLRKGAVSQAGSESSAALTISTSRVMALPWMVMRRPSKTFNKIRLTSCGFMIRRIGH